MESTFCFCVMVETDDRASLETWNDWIVSSGHLARVCAAGPLEAEIRARQGA
jgi:hypothetical protein